MSGQIHFWNQSQYASYSQGTGIGINGGTRYISGFQGFFTKASSSLSTLSVSESAKPASPQNNTFLRVSTEEPSDVARIILRGPSGNQDETAIRWMAESSGSYEENLDADKLINPGLSFFSNTAEGRLSSIQARNFIDKDSIHLGYKASQYGSHFLEIHISPAFCEGKILQIRDNESGFVYPVTADMLFPFYVTEGLEISNYRFTLLIENTPVSTASVLKTSNLNVYPNPAHESVEVAFEGEKVAYELTNLVGKTVGTGVLSKDGNRSVSLNSIAPGIYNLMIRENSGSMKVTKLIVK
jgi:hypothetical protein